MGDTSIEWTNKTWNPIRGCSVVSEGCRNCYAMQIAARFNKPGQAYEGLGYCNSSGAHWTGDVRAVEEHLTDPLHWRKPSRVFVNSMSDLFHESVPFKTIARIFGIMHHAKRHTFQILTKRPERMREFIPWYRQNWLGKGFESAYPREYGHVHLGVSVEDQKTADERIPLLLQTPAAVRWISAEPLLGPVDLTRWLATVSVCRPGDLTAETISALQEVAKTAVRNQGHELIDWVVVGGESGPKARPMHPDWARSLRDQCVAAGVPFFFKQWGAWKEFGHDEDGPNIEEVEAGTELCESLTPLQDGFISLDGHFAKRLKDVKPDTHYRGLERLGKKTAGRLLDGREWNQFPQVVNV